MSDNKKEDIKSGWDHLIGKATKLSDIILSAKIESISRVHGMLRIKFAPVLDKYEQWVLDSIAYKLERESSITCEECGMHSSRRLELPLVQSLCTKCYTLRYNDFMESIASDVINQEPQ